MKSWQYPKNWSTNVNFIFQSEKLAISQNLEYECKLATLEMLYVWKCLTLTESQSQEIIQTVNGESCLAIVFIISVTYHYV